MARRNNSDQSFQRRAASSKIERETSSFHFSTWFATRKQIRKYFFKFICFSFQVDHRNISTRVLGKQFASTWIDVILLSFSKFISLDELCNIFQVPPETPSIGVPPDFSLLESSTNSRSNQRAPITTDSLLMPSSTLNSSVRLLIQMK